MHPTHRGSWAETRLTVYRPSDIMNCGIRQAQSLSVFQYFWRSVLITWFWKSRDVKRNFVYKNLMHLEAWNALSIIKNAIKNASFRPRPVVWKNGKKWSFFENLKVFSFKFSLLPGLFWAVLEAFRRQKACRIFPVMARLTVHRRLQVRDLALP